MLTALPALDKAQPKVPTLGVFATSDPRVDAASRERCVNIVEQRRRSWKVRGSRGRGEVSWRCSAGIPLLDRIRRPKESRQGQ